MSPTTRKKILEFAPVLVFLTQVKVKRVRYLSHVDYMRHTRNAYKISVKNNSMEETILEKPYRHEVKNDLKETERACELD
jgi:hypothetical protein